MSQVQTIKTLVHEIAHAKLHRPDDILAIHLKAVWGNFHFFGEGLSVWPQKRLPGQRVDFLPFR